MGKEPTHCAGAIGRKGRECRKEYSSGYYDGN